MRKCGLLDTEFTEHHLLLVAVPVVWSLSLRNVVVPLLLVLAVPVVWPRSLRKVVASCADAAKRAIASMPSAVINMISNFSASPHSHIALRLSAPPDSAPETD